nr:PREDICTED: histone-lysine N-methyltransferase 2B-like [Musa acuminata subsp. malaccensis]
MTPDEQTKGSVPGDGGLRMGKKNKQKKIPQRGLGVAQLEKLRLEEQQKKGASSSSDPSTQGFGFPPPPPPPPPPQPQQQQQQPYFPLAADEGVMRPRVALVVPVNSYPVISMPPPRPVAQDTSMPVLWNAGDPNACDEETLRVPVFIPTEATKKMAAFSPCVPSALPPTHHSINPIMVTLVRQEESGALCFTPFLRSSLSSSSLIELACLLQDERPYYSFIPIGPSRSETATSERRGEAADGIDLNLKL